MLETCLLLMSLEVPSFPIFPLDLSNQFLKDRKDKQTAAYANAEVAFRAEQAMQLPSLLAYFFLRDVNVMN